MYADSEQEHYDIGSEEEKVHYNLWIPDEDLPGFRNFMLDFFWEFESLSKLVLDALLEGLEIDKAATDYYRSMHTGHQNGIRPIHYPPINESLIDRESPTWCPTHTDFTSFTLLAQDLASGLQIQDRTNPGTFCARGCIVKMSVTATMEVFMTKTKTLEDNVSEQVRLEDQHETVIRAMGGKPLFAPVDLSRPGLKILDSGCANGEDSNGLIDCPTKRITRSLVERSASCILG